MANHADPGTIKLYDQREDLAKLNRTRGEDRLSQN
jgi:hypothetical protein